MLDDKEIKKYIIMTIRGTMYDSYTYMQILNATMFYSLICVHPQKSST